MGYTSQQELNVPDLAGQIALINPLEPVEDTTDNRGSNLQAASTDFTQALLRAIGAIEFEPVTQVSLSWNYATRELVVSGGDLVVEVVWVDLFSGLLATPTQIVLQAGTHQLMAHLMADVRLDPGATRTIAPGDMVALHAFVTGSASVEAHQLALDAIGNTDFVATTYESAQQVQLHVPLFRISGTALSLFGGRVVIRNGYQHKLLDRDTQYVQVFDDTISITASVGAMTLIGQANSSIQFGDSSSFSAGLGSLISLGDSSSLEMGVGAVVDLDDTFQIELGQGGTLTIGDDLITSVGADSIWAFGAGTDFRFNTDFVLGVWDGAAFDNGLQSLAGTLDLFNNTGADLLITNDGVTGDILINALAGNIEVEAQAGDTNLLAPLGDCNITVGGEVDIDAAELLVTLTGGASNITQTSPVAGLTIRTQGNNSDLALRTSGASAELELLTAGAGSDISLTTELDNSFIRLLTTLNDASIVLTTLDVDSPIQLTTNASWAAATHPGSYIRLQGPGGSVARMPGAAFTTESLEALPYPVVLLVSGEAHPAPLVDGEMEAVTLAIENTLSSVIAGGRRNRIEFLGKTTADLVYPHQQAWIEARAGESANNWVSDFSIWVNDGISPVENFRIEGGEKASVLGMPLVVEQDGSLSVIGSFELMDGGDSLVATAAMVVRDSSATGVFLEVGNKDASDALLSRGTGIIFTGVDGLGADVGQAALLARHAGIGADNKTQVELRIADDLGTNEMKAVFLVTTDSDFFVYPTIWADDGIRSDGDVEVVGEITASGNITAQGSSKVYAPNQIWAAATIDVNAAISEEAAADHTPLRTTGIVNAMRVDSVIRRTASSYYELHLSEALPAFAKAQVLCGVVKNLHTPYTHFVVYAEVLSDSIVGFSLVDIVGTAQTEFSLADRVHVAFYILTGE